MIPATDALQRLQDGNRRFVAGAQSDVLATHSDRLELTGGQNPFAIILGCSDSRVPAEIVFDQGLGDLFVIRVAGNIVAASQLGSIEFAAQRFGTRLVVVLGHTNCGAATAAIEDVVQPGANASEFLRSIVDPIRPSAEAALAAVPRSDWPALLESTIRGNVRASAGDIRRRSTVIQELIRRDGLRVVGAEYSLETGVVDFFDGTS
jgi:carbonic anhydrase